MNSRDPRQERLEQRTQGVSTLLAAVLIVLLIQLWLITLALEAHLAADPGLAIPTFVASAVCFLVNLGLLRYLYQIDRLEE